MKEAVAVCVPIVSFVAPVNVADVPQRKPTVTDVAVPRLVVAPLSVAPEVVIVVAALVVTDGGVEAVVKLMITPRVNPLP